MPKIFPAIWSFQYKKPCVVASSTDAADDVIAACHAGGAVRLYDDLRQTPQGLIEGDRGALEEFIVQLRDEVGPELWTEAALRRSLGKGI